MQQLAGLGKVAGIGGIVIGALVLLLRPLIEGVLPGLEPAAQAQAVQAIVIGAFALGGLGILAWIIATLASRTGGASVRTRGGQSPGVIAGGGVAIGGDPGGGGQTAADDKRRSANSTMSVPTGRVATRGDASPGVISGGKVSIRDAGSGGAPREDRRDSS